MDILVLEPIIVFIALTILSILFMRRYPKVFFAVTLGITVIGVILFAIVFMDVVDLQKHFQNSTKIVFLEQDGRLLAGIEMSEDPVAISNSSLKIYNDLYQQKSYEAMLGKNYKLMIFSIKAIEDLQQTTFYVQDIEVSKENILKAVQSDDPVQYISNGITISEDSQYIKSLLLGVVLSNGVLDQNNPLYFFEQYKQGNIFIYPETAVFKAMKIIPLSSIRTVVEKASAKLLQRQII